MIPTVRAAIPALVFGLMLGGTTASNAEVSDPAGKQVEAFYVTLIDSMQHAKELGVQGRYKKLEPAVESTFDLPEMARLTVGPSWMTMSEADRMNVIAAFRRMTIANYASSFDGYDGQKFDVDPNVQERNGDKIVRSSMTATGKEPVQFIYRMHQAGGAWKATDVFLNGSISQVATRRSDFSSTLQSGGGAALAAKVNTLADNLMRGK
jgi:phospholipid transport system substrate-binding protein